MPASRCSAGVLVKITQSIADALYEQELRDLSLHDRYQMIGLKEDVRGSHLLVIGRFVDQDLNVTTKLVDLQDTEGAKTAMDKVHQIESALRTFTHRRAGALEALQNRIVSYS